MAAYNIPILYIYCRLKRLNDCFKHYFIVNSTKSKDVKVFRIVCKSLKTSVSNGKLRLVLQFGEIYDLLNNSLTIINSMFSVYIMCCISLYFIYTVTTIYTAYVFVFVRHDVAAIITMNCTIVSTVLLTVSLFTLILSCACLSDEGDNTARLIHIALTQLNEVSPVSEAVIVSPAINKSNMG